MGMDALMKERLYIFTFRNLSIHWKWRQMVVR